MAAHPAERSVRPGDELALRLELRRYRGETLPSQRLGRSCRTTCRPAPTSCFVGDGGTIDGARLTMEPTEPEDFREALELLRSLHRPTDLVVLGVLPSPGLVVDGRTLPRLPGSVRSIWSASGPLTRQAGGPRRARRRCPDARLPARRRRARRPASAAAPKLERGPRNASAPIGAEYR